MALRRLGVQQVLPVENRENAYPGIQAKGLGSQPVSNQPRRAALGDIANKTQNQLAKRMTVKAEDSKPKRTLTKSKATTSLLSEKATVAPEKPASEIVDLHDIKVELEEIDDVLHNVEDIDEDDRYNPQLCAEYVNEIYSYMREMERKYHITGEPLAIQTEVNSRMRAILMDWLIQVHLRFHLLQETLFMTVDIIDRFLAVYPVTRQKLQLVGVSAMLLASKYEEMYAPEIGDFVYITDNAYSKAQIRGMETTIFKTLDYSIGKPLCLHFLRRNSKAGNVNAMHHTLAKYLLELSIIDSSCTKFLPSEKAAAALCVSIKVIDNMEWTPTLKYYSTYSEEQLNPAIKALSSLIIRASQPDFKQKAVRTKYSSQKFMKVATQSWVNGTSMERLSKS